jgi:hypothetical protein
VLWIRVTKKVVGVFVRFRCAAVKNTEIAKTKYSHENIRLTDWNSRTEQE